MQHIIVPNIAWQLLTITITTLETLEVVYTERVDYWNNVIKTHYTTSFRLRNKVPKK